MNPVFPFPLKTGTSKLNIHCCGILPSNKVSLNVAVKDLTQAGFQDNLRLLSHFSCYLLHASSSSVLCTASSTTVAAKLPPLTFNNQQSFHMFLPDLFSFTPVFLIFQYSFFIFKSIYPNNIKFFCCPLFCN